VNGRQVRAGAAFQTPGSTVTAIRETANSQLRELGHQLAARRAAAGLTQEGLARRTGYSRSTISTAELGTRRGSLQFWASCDAALGGGDDLVAARRGTGLPRAPGPGDEMLAAAAAGQALVAGPDTADGYRALGWTARSDASGKLTLVTGAAIDVLDVARPAGLLAAGWWTSSQGASDLVRGLPSLPDPAAALALIDDGQRCWFVTRAGECPWAPETAPGAADGTSVIRWHSHGSRVPAPPAGATWAHPPHGGMRLPSPVALLDLLVKAVAVADSPAALTFPGGVVAIPGHSGR
jgi:DNA-binding XRE family transcriptional regulator